MDAETLVILLSAMTAFVSAFAVWSALLHRDPAARRAEFLASQREALRAGVATQRRRKPQQDQSMTMMRQVVDKLQLMKSTQAEKIKINLARAGMRSNDAVVRYLFMKLALPFAFGGIALFMVYGLEAFPMEGTNKLLATLAMVVFGAYFPDVMIKNAATKRQKEITKQLPDGLDLMVICAEAGLSLDATLMRVADELATAGPELSDELSLTSLELGFLAERQTALNNMSVRCNLPAVRGMVNTMMQAERYGTPLAHSLRVLSQESRDDRMMRAEEKAARLPALLTVPMIIFILPPLFIVLLGPAILDVMDNFTGTY
jgi:tight adherence protein C